VAEADKRRMTLPLQSGPEQSAPAAPRRGGCERPQESPNSPQFPPRNRRATPLAFLLSSVGQRDCPAAGNLNPQERSMNSLYSSVRSKPPVSSPLSPISGVSKVSRQSRGCNKLRLRSRIG
jgi:hypothetical protein